MKTSRVISTIFKYVVLLAIVVYLVFVVVMVIWPAEDVKCEGIEVRFDNEGASPLISEDDVIRILQVNKIDPVGQSFSSIDTKVIDSLLKENPFVDSVVSYPNSSGLLRIQLVTSHPILHIISIDGEDYYLESNGKVLPCSGRNANLCVVTGYVTQQFAKDNLLGIGRILCSDPYWKLQAQQIDITSDGKIQLVSRMGNHVLMLGDSRNIVDKLDRIRIFYEKEMPQVGWDAYKSISAEFDGQLVCTRK